MYHSALNPNSGLRGVDFDQYYRAGARLNAGQPLYQTELRDADGRYSGGYYNPGLILLMRPLAGLPYETALRCWFFVNAAALLVAIGFFAKGIGIKLADGVSMSIIIIVSFRFWPMVCSFGLGQMNCLMLALLGVAFWADGRGRMLNVGICIALAATLKLWMIGAVIYLIARRAWKAAVWTGAVFALMMCISVIAVGSREWKGFVDALRMSSIQPWLISQSIPGFARLHLTENALVEPLLRSHGIANGFVVLTAIAMLFGLWVVSKRPVVTNYDRGVLFGVSLVTLLLLLPLCHMEYFIFALPLLWTVLAAPCTAVRPPYVFVLAAIFYIAFTRPVPVSGAGVDQYREGLKSMVVSIPFFLGCGLWLVGVKYLLGQSRANGPQPFEGDQLRLRVGDRTVDSAA